MMKKERVPHHSSSRRNLNSKFDSISHLKSIQYSTLTTDNPKGKNISKESSKNDSINTHFAVVSAQQSYLQKISHKTEARERFSNSNFDEYLDHEAQEKIKKNVRNNFNLTVINVR